MKNYLTLVLLFIFLSIQAQHKYSSSTYEVTNKDVQINIFPQDSLAKSLIIFEEGESYVDKESFKLMTKFKTKIKILDKDESDKANVEIYLYNNNKNTKEEEVLNIKAITYNLTNNQIVTTQLKQSDIFTERINKNYQVTKFTLPNIKDGSVITYEYTLKSPFFFKYKGWQFQEDVPKLYSEYRTSIPANYEYHIKLVGTQDLDTHESSVAYQCLAAGIGSYSDCTITKYVMKDIPAFIEEDYMTSKSNFMSRIEYELKVVKRFDGGIDKITKTWKDVDKELKTDKSIGKQILKKSGTKNLISEDIQSISDPLTKAKAIYKYIQDTYAWNGEYKIFSDVSVKDLIKNKSGKVTEINILLYNLLLNNDIEANPVLLSTRKNGLATQLYPVLSDFNYLIVKAKINGKDYLLDGTEDYLSFGEIPFRCLNSYGRQLDFKKGSTWIDIEPNLLTNTQHRVKVNLDEDGLITGTVNSRYSGYHSFSKKESYFSNPTAYKESLKNNTSSIEILDIDILSQNKTESGFHQKFNFEYDELNSVGDELYLDPFILKFFTKNPFLLQQRTYPIEFGYPSSYIYTMQIDPGDLYELKEVPEVTTLKIPNGEGSLVYNVTPQNGKIIVYLKIDFRKGTYPSNYYNALKELMSKVVNIQTKTLLVLKKK